MKKLSKMELDKKILYNLFTDYEGKHIEPTEINDLVNRVILFCDNFDLVKTIIFMVHQETLDYKDTILPSLDNKNYFMIFLVCVF